MLGRVHARFSPLPALLICAALVYAILKGATSPSRNVLDDLEHFIDDSHEDFEPEVTAHDIEARLAEDVSETVADIKAGDLPSVDVGGFVDGVQDLAKGVGDTISEDVNAVTHASLPSIGDSLQGFIEGEHADFVPDITASDVGDDFEVGAKKLEEAVESAVDDLVDAGDGGAEPVLPSPAP